MSLWGILEAKPGRLGVPGAAGEVLPALCGLVSIAAVMGSTLPSLESLCLSGFIRERDE